MCGCKKGLRSVGKRPIVTPRTKSISVNPKVNTPTQAKVAKMQEVQAASLESAGMDKKRREVERKRRLAILKRLGKL